jgi:molybdopterin-guanine dinucleotide biosynthesis protein A
MGRPKAWLPFGSERMLQRVVRIVSTVVNHIVVIAAPDQDLPALPDTITIARDPIRGKGPLQGLAAGLAALPETVELAFATATDVPFLEPAWITRLADLIGENDIAIPWTEGFHHPLAALYRRKSVLPVIERLLQANRLRPVFLIEHLSTRIIGTDELREIDPLLRTLRNLNTPEDYTAALVEAGFEPAGPGSTSSQGTTAHV